MTAVVKLSADGKKIEAVAMFEGDYTPGLEKPGNYIVLPVVVVKPKEKKKGD